MTFILHIWDVFSKNKRKKKKALSKTRSTVEMSGGGVYLDAGPPDGA